MPLRRVWRLRTELRGGSLGAGGKGTAAAFDGAVGARQIHQESARRRPGPRSGPRRIQLPIPDADDPALRAVAQRARDTVRLECDRLKLKLSSVVPAKSRDPSWPRCAVRRWVPAFAGTTIKGGCDSA